MSKIIVVGAGMMGLPIIYALSKLGHDVYIVEKDKNTLDNALSFLDGQKIYVADYTNELDRFDDSHIDNVISAAPYSVNYLIAYNCLQNRRRYCDLGGNPIIDEHIQDYYTKLSKKPCICSLGLAPGFVNLLLSHSKSFIDDFSGATVKLRVGGLPLKPNNFLGYNKVFSLDGLYNEYNGKCKIIKDYKVVEVDALSELDNVDFLCDTNHGNAVEYLEAFHTKGGLGNTINSMLDLKVKSCDYKTIRYKGHCNIIKFLLDDCKLSQKAFCEAIENACPATKADKVLISVDVIHNKGQWVRRACVESDENWTSMQLTTAFPAAAVASIMAEGLLDGKSVLTYDDIPIKLLFDKLEKIGGLNLKFFK